jgi:hypothetical protein
MILSRSAAYVVTTAAALFFLSCGGGGSPVEPPRPTPTPLPAPTALPTPTPSPNAACGPNLASGPVTRFAIAPRAQLTNGQEVPIRVWIQGPWQEAWCIDKDKEHKLDFNANQRNADGRECCWVKDPEWSIADDKDRIVLGHGELDDHRFVYRLGVGPRNLETTFGVEAVLDGVKSKAWQSGPTVGYPEGPLKIVTLSAADIEKNCKCTYFGNGNYNPECVGR